MSRSSSLPARRRWSENDARRVLAMVEASGLPVSAFAARRGLNPQRLYVWRRRLAAEGRPPTAFIELKAVDSARIEVQLRSGHVLRVPERFDATTLRKLLDVLGS